MFVVEMGEPQRLGDDGKALVDRQREVVFRQVQGLGPTRRAKFKVTVAGHTFGFVGCWPEGSSEPSSRRSQSHLHWVIEDFGQRLVANPFLEPEEIPAAHFKNSRERGHAARLSIEALLRFGFSYDGGTFSHRTETVEFEGKVYSLSDFPGSI